MANGSFVEVDIDLKDAVSNAGDPESPFSVATKAGNDATVYQDGGKLLRLDDSGSFSKGGYLTFTVAEGWRVIIRVATENVNYFEDELDSAYQISLGDDPSTTDISNGLLDLKDDEVLVWEDNGGFFGEDQSNMIVVLNGGDIFVMDVDADHVSAKNAFRLFKDGREYVLDYGDSSVRPNDDTFVRLVGAYKFFEEIDPTTEQATAPEGDGDIQVPFPVNDEVEVVVVEEGEDPPAETSDPPPQAGGTGAGYLAIVDPDGDFDGDGTSNADEIKDDTDESDDVSSGSIFLVFLAIGAILIGSFMMLRRGSAGGSA